MRAVVARAPGSQESIKNVPVPKPEKDEVLVRIVAAGVNPIDWKNIEREDQSFPVVMGQDFAGVVVEVGKNVHGAIVDQSVFGIAREHGSFAEFTLVPIQDQRQPFAAMPNGLSFVDAAALPTAGLTALAALDALHVGAGSNLLIVGVSGGVGSLAAQIAQQRGARVVGTAHSSHRDFVEGLGSVAPVFYDLEDPVEAARAHAPEGFDAVLDVVDDRSESRRLTKAIKRGGAVVSTIDGVDAEHFAHHDISATNIVMNETPASSAGGLTELGRMVVSNQLRVPIDVRSALVMTPQALDESRTGHTVGKTVVMVGAP